MSDQNVPWQPIAPLPNINGEISVRLDSVDNLQAAWKESLRDLSPAEVEASLKRRLRRHAIETGIIERLYDMSWGVTEALVAEGLTMEIASSQGEVATATMETITDQFEGLTYLVEWVRD